MRTVFCRALVFITTSILSLKAQKIDLNFDWLPLDSKVSIGMGLEDFRTQNTAAKPLGKKEFFRNREREKNIVFLENLDGERNSLKSKSKARYYFFEGFLTRIEWKNSEGKLNFEDAELFEKQLAQRFGNAVTSEQFFFVGKLGVARFLTKTFSDNGYSIHLVASNLFIELAITDNKLLEKSQKVELLESASDDFAIRETYGASIAEIINPPEVIDFFTPTSTNRRSHQTRDLSEQGNFGNSTSNKSVDGQKHGEAKIKSSLWLYWVLGLVILGGVAKLVLNDNKK